MQKIDKNMQIGIFALVVVVIAYFFGSRKGKGLSLVSTGAELDAEIKQNPLTYELSQYSALADRLETAMFKTNDDEAAVYDVFSDMRNRSDVLQLIKSFGKRRQQFTIGNMGLSSWLNYQLNSSEVKHINEILSRNDINFTF